MDLDNEVRVGLVGAGGGFGRTVLLALRHHPTQRPTILCDLDTASVTRTLAELNYDRPARRCAGPREVRAAVDRGEIAVVTDLDALDPQSYDVLVEATGVVPVSARAAIAAIEQRRPVVMVSKETDATIGLALAQRARSHGVSVRAGAGDQPANLAALVEWARGLGLEIVAGGKSSEYDLVLDHHSGVISLLERHAPGDDLLQHWELGDDAAATIAARQSATSGFKLRTAADYCEIAVAANLTGLGIDTPTLHYPILRTTELPNALRPRAESGLLGRAGVLDVFTSLRRPDEASFAGGVFVVVRVHDEQVAELLAAKGHAVSTRRDLLTIGLPYHLMGLEIPLSIAEAHTGAPAVRSSSQVSMLARTTAPLTTGHQLVVTGHHHEIAHTSPVLATGDIGGAAPYYALDGARLRREVPEGHVIHLEDVEGVDPLVLELLREQQHG